MKKLILGILMGLSLSAQATDVDFSRAYVIPEQSGANTVTLGGVAPDWMTEFFSVNFMLTPTYDMKITGILNQSALREQLEQKLRNTTWQGTYAVNNDNFTTTLKLVVVQDGYVGGEVTHSESVATGNGYLHARVTGDILNQYSINNVFTDEDRIAPNVLANLPLNTPTRQLIRIKRVRALEFRDDADGSSWSTNREYRMTLENGVLSGIVGIPSDTYGSGDGTSGNGDVRLTLVR